MFCIFDDLGTIEVSVHMNGDFNDIEVKGMSGDFWNDIFPLMLSSKDPDAPLIIEELLTWLESEGIYLVSGVGRRDSTSDDTTTASGDHNKDNSKSYSMSTSYIDKFVETLIEFKKAPGMRMVQAMAGHQPILVAKSTTEEYGFSFPPDTFVYTPDEVREMARTGHYVFGKRYMDKLIEVLLG